MTELREALTQVVSAETPNNILPNSMESREETRKTCKTCAEVTNIDFITGIFGDLEAEYKPIVVSFGGNPALKERWYGLPATQRLKIPTNHNNYVSFATYKPDQKGEYRRQKIFFNALHALMLDDICSKVEIDRITLQPSWMIETSSGNFQIGYIFKDPITDAKTVDSLGKAVVAAGLTDPGAGGFHARLGRLPVAINGKRLNDANEPFKCKLTDWQPELKYSLDELIDGLQIDLSDKKSPHKTKKTHQATRIDADFDDDVHIPQADENPVIAELKKRGLYKTPLGDIKHDITCPWLHDHTDAVDNGTAYFEPSESYPLGGFKCQHGHCAKRRVSALHEFLGISKIDAKHKPKIYIQAGEIPRICDAAEIELSKTLRHYQRGGIIVTINTDPSTKETAVKTLTLPSLTRALAGLAIWWRYDKRSEQWVLSDPSEKHTRVLFDAVNYQHLPVLNGIARQPFLRPDYSLMRVAGYDAVTGMYGVFIAQKFNIPDAPTFDDARKALSELIDLLSEFAFKTDHDQAAALAAILTAAIRPSLIQAPMVHVKAPSISSGKSYLCELFTAFATPQKGTPHAFPQDDEECRKLLLAELLTAPAVIEFDNLTSDLIPHKSLCTTLTSEFISGRILGVSKTAEVGTRTLFLSSGNNVEPVRDMTRRALTITLDPACETPATRDFKKQPVKEVRQKREYFVSLALTIVRAWHCAGRPKAPVKTIASYDEWSDLCRHSLIWLGLPDPAQCIFESMATDPDRDLLAQMLRGWHSRFGTSPYLLRDVLRQVSANDEELIDAIKEVAAERDGQINARRFGWWMKKHCGRVVGGMRFIQDESFSSGNVMWRLHVLHVLHVSAGQVTKSVRTQNDMEVF